MMVKCIFSVLLAKLRKLLIDLSRTNGDETNRDEDTTIFGKSNIDNNIDKEHSLLSLFNV